MSATLSEYLIFSQFSVLMLMYRLLELKSVAIAQQFSNFFSPKNQLNFIDHFVTQILLLGF